MNPNKLIVQMRLWVAYSSVGPSTVRGQRSPGLVTTMRKLLSNVELERFARCPPRDFDEMLDDDTATIQQGMPHGCRHWGVARKVLNIFLRGAAYNTFLRDKFKLHRIEGSLELPLDSLTIGALKLRSPARTLPRWLGVKHLTKADSDRFQARASEIAVLPRYGVNRVHLDTYFWLERTRSVRTDETNSL